MTDFTNYVLTKDVAFFGKKCRHFRKPYFCLNLLEHATGKRGRRPIDPIAKTW